MPVVNILLSRFKKFLPALSQEKIIEMLPFAGLDIEGIDAHMIRVEYNPNRPDFSSDYGIFRALRGLIGKETGPPTFKLKNSNVSVIIDGKANTIRPHVVALTAEGGVVDDQTIKQLLAMQEDLHEGIGRRRKKASIGIHNLDPIKFPVRYTTVDADFSFVPLAESSSRTIQQVLQNTGAGRQFGQILEDPDSYPALLDKSGSLISLPPIINADMTRVDQKTRNLFVEVTSTSAKVADDILAIIAITLHDAGFRIGSVTIEAGRKKFKSPKTDSSIVAADLSYINSILGLDLDAKQVVRCLKKCRLGAVAKGKKVICKVPRYRSDITHPIDIVEEAAIGFGVYNLEPTLPVSSTAGTRSIQSNYFDAISEVLSGLGMLESVSFSLTSTKAEYGVFARSADSSLHVEGPKSAEHEVLRDSLIPSLLQSLSRNVHEEYPQKLFEIGRVFHGGTTIGESWTLSAVTAHGDAGYTEIKSYLQALLSSGFGKSCATVSAPSAFFIPGRSANVLVDGMLVGAVGEIIPMALQEHRLRVPVAAFEIDLGKLLHLPQ
jgi:phenylalanyl-tRNA synthetase beta chain